MALAAIEQPIGQLEAGKESPYRRKDSRGCLRCRSRFRGESCSYLGLMRSDCSAPNKSWASRCFKKKTRPKHQNLGAAFRFWGLFDELVHVGIKRADLSGLPNSLDTRAVKCRVNHRYKLSHGRSANRRVLPFEVV